jgi:hypothetical protein
MVIGILEVDYRTEFCEGSQVANIFNRVSTYTKPLYSPKVTAYFESVTAPFHRSLPR